LRSRLTERDARFCFRFLFLKISEFAGGSVFYFFPAKKSGGGAWGVIQASVLGAWLPVSFVGRKHHNAVWLFMCDCGSVSLLMAAIAVTNLPPKEKTRAAGQGRLMGLSGRQLRECVQRRNSSGNLAMFAAIRRALIIAEQLGGRTPPIHWFTPHDRSGREILSVLPI
jgi:hypothetical protein